MPPLNSTLRSQLERTVIAARDVAEEGAWAALQRLAVDRAQPPGHLSATERELRVKLRGRGRQLGDERDKKRSQDIYYLHRECAYEHWHQMLFARFLAENQLLMHPDSVAVSLEECEELAAEEGTDGWTLAARYASRMLPQIFRPDDPLLAVAFAPEDKQALEKLLADLPQDVFTADDSLGWVYQFWQTKRKKEVNDSGEKIGADELPAVTQLFTEDYMVKFLLHNTLGAWWAGKQLTAEDCQDAQSEDELRAKVALPGVEWEYLRFVRDPSPSPSEGEGRGEGEKKDGQWRPATGTFDGWPKPAAELKIMDPCCGSGHFLVATFDLMVRIRMEEEGLSAVEACDAVLRDNLHGLEIDQRCTQIAAFALAFAAWTFPDAGGYRELPALHIACTGIAPEATEEQWIRLTEESGISMPRGGREPIRNGLANLHRIFSRAPVLGSLIENPTELPSDLIAADFETLRPYIAAAMASEHVDEDMHQRAATAAGMVAAAELLGPEYNFVLTNVPYLGRGAQCEALAEFTEQSFCPGRADLATAFLLRNFDFLIRDGVAALVLPQNWLFLASYRDLREGLLKSISFDALARLGPGAFGTISGEVVKAILLIATDRAPSSQQRFLSLDVSRKARPAEKEEGLLTLPIMLVCQQSQLQNPDAIITGDELKATSLLSDFASSVEGLPTGDGDRFVRVFWEVAKSDTWSRFQASPERTMDYGGCHRLVMWENGDGELARSPQARSRAAGLGESWSFGWADEHVAMLRL